jgi:hypothetical protein
MIRLLETCDLSLHVFDGRKIPPYAILSHRWDDGEITLQEFQGGLNQANPGWQKIRQFCEYARQKEHAFVWIDTCCIDKTSSAELSEAINSMFSWYRKAECCYAYLNDVPARGDHEASTWTRLFKASKWFTRGWTLQEMLAPHKLIFVCDNWREDVGTRASLSAEISQATRIPGQPLINGWSLQDAFGGTQYTIAQVLSWASTRETTRIEDVAYSLMGLLRINMPLLYGEGANAFIRLQLEVMGKYDDNSLFAWRMPQVLDGDGSIRAINRSLDVSDSYWWGGLLAPTIQCFRDCTGHFLHLKRFGEGPLFTMTSRGVQVDGRLRRYEKNLHGRKRWLLPLNCGRDGLWSQHLAVVLVGDGQFAMRVVNTQGLEPDLVDCDNDAEKRLKKDYEQAKVFVPQAWPGDFDTDAP